jgi:hypothetical protein
VMSALVMLSPVTVFNVSVVHKGRVNDDSNKCLHAGSGKPAWQCSYCSSIPYNSWHGLRL